MARNPATIARRLEQRSESEEEVEAQCAGLSVLEPTESIDRQDDQEHQHADHTEHRRGHVAVQLDVCLARLRVGVDGAGVGVVGHGSEGLKACGLDEL